MQTPELPLHTESFVHMVMNLIRLDPHLLVTHDKLMCDLAILIIEKSSLPWKGRTQNLLSDHSVKVQNYKNMYQLDCYIQNLGFIKSDQMEVLSVTLTL